MTVHHGNLIIDKDTLEYARTLTELHGSAVITFGGLTLPNLKIVRDRLTITGNDVALPVLDKVHGTVELLGDRANLPALTAIGRGMQLQRRDANLPSLVSIGGGLIINTLGVAMPELRKIEGGLFVDANSGLVELPSLRSVGLGFVKFPQCKFDYSKITFARGVVLAVWEYALFYKDGEYSAGCRGPWTAEQALAHWNKTHKVPERAKLFREAILTNEAKFNNQEKPK